MGKRIDKAALDTAMNALNSLFGLDGPKEEIKKIATIWQMCEKRADVGLPTFPFQHKNMVFLGNPGTGKSLFARHVGEIYRALGVLSKGHVVECDRSELVAGYIGQTQAKTQRVIDRAKGGILFIDGADNLYSGNSHDFCNEALDAIYREIHDIDVDLAVVLSGCDEAMMDFLRANPGFDLKFRSHIRFDDLSPDVLYGIFANRLKQSSVGITAEAEDAARKHFEFICEKKNRWFGNAREAQIYFEQVFTKCTKRILDTMGISGAAAITITLDDIPEDK